VSALVRIETGFEAISCKNVRANLPCGELIRREMLCEVDVARASPVA
jgi:hypothetical protein